MDITYNVRVWKIETVQGKRVTSYKVPWKVGTKRWKQTFQRQTQADSFRSELISAQRRGEGFSLATGRPVSWQRRKESLTWYAFALAFVDMKWPYASPNHRRGIAEALTDATEVFTSSAGTPERKAVRAALRDWAFSARVHPGSSPPEEYASVLRWLESNTIELRELADPGSGAVLVRTVLDRISRKLDGTQAAANTANRKRMVINNAMNYAVEIGELSTNPLGLVKWQRPRTVKQVDMRTVVNSDQAARLLAAVEGQGERGRRMVAFFALMYYAALRPEEAIYLSTVNLESLPDGGWGLLRLSNAEPRAGTKWTNSGRSREPRELKHRAPGETRPVPAHPELVRYLRTHLTEFPPTPDGRVFVGPRGGTIAEWAYLDVWENARNHALSAVEAASPLAGTPYALRHACVSTWLGAGVNPAQVAEWAGHSVDVLHRVYAKAVAGQEAEAQRRIEEATRRTEEEDE